jgi:hypothetical protein
MVVVAVLLVVATTALLTFGRQRPRTRLTGAAAEMQALLHAARQNALSSGFPTVVMVFPAFSSSGGTGRVIVYEDHEGTLFSAAAAVNFGTYNPATAVAGPQSLVVGDLDLPREVSVGPPDGQGSFIMPAPFDRVPVNAACTFCGADRGAIAFDVRGQASFYAGNGAPAVVQGGSLSIYNPSDTPAADTAANATAIRTLTVVAPTGAVRVLKKG